MRLEDLRARREAEEKEWEQLGVIDTQAVIIEDGGLEEEEDETLEDLNEALELLDSWVNQMNPLLRSRKKRLSIMQELELAELTVETETFLDQWNFTSRDQLVTNVDS